MTDSRAPAASASSTHVGSQGETDVSCFKCSYNLRGLPVNDATCPECGSSVNESIIAGRQRAAEAPAMGKLGVTMLLMGVCLVLFASLLLLLPERTPNDRRVSVWLTMLLLIPFVYLHRTALPAFRAARVDQDVTPHQLLARNRRVVWLLYLVTTAGTAVTLWQIIAWNVVGFQTMWQHMLQIGTTLIALWVFEEVSLRTFILYTAIMTYSIIAFTFGKVIRDHAKGMLGLSRIIRASAWTFCISAMVIAIDDYSGLRAALHIDGWSIRSSYFHWAIDKLFTSFVVSIAVAFPLLLCSLIVGGIRLMRYDRKVRTTQA